MRSSLQTSRGTGKATKIGCTALIALLWGTTVLGAPIEDKPVVRLIGRIHSPTALRILKRIQLVPLRATHDSPILLQGETVLRLHERQKRELKATYLAGYSIALLDAKPPHTSALHVIVGEGINYRSKKTVADLAYVLRKENYVPTATLLTYVARSPLQTANGDPDPVGLADTEQALDRAADRTVLELQRTPKVGLPAPVHDPNQPIAWQDNPLATITFAIQDASGVYNTPINVYALHRCLDGTDHYAVTAGADWTPTHATWQGVTSEEPNASMTVDASGNLVLNWQNVRTYCSSVGTHGFFDDICRYINYPLSYQVAMVPRSEGTVVQIDAAPAATQGEQTTYQSGLNFSIGGTVNVSAKGPAAGLSLGATWVNVTQTTVPPLIVEAGNIGNEGAFWNFKYCTTGLEPDPGTNCTSHVQMVKDVCQAQLGDDSGTNPQQGQTPDGKFSNAVESVHWQTGPDTRVGKGFDIEVEFVANIANTVSHLGVPYLPPDTIWNCNAVGCACVSVTESTPVSESKTFEVPFPSTKCE